MGIFLAQVVNVAFGTNISGNYFHHYFIPTPNLVLTRFFLLVYFSHNFECGLCGEEFKEREDLEIHLNTCEIFECSSCWLRDVNISEMKNHERGKHSSTTEVNHLKMHREKQHIVSSNFYFLKDL